MKRFLSILCLVSFAVYMLTGCENRELKNSYLKNTVNPVQNGSIQDAANHDLNTFSKDIAILPHDFQNSFSYDSDAGEMLLINNSKDKILFQKNSMAQIAPASTTKLLTAYIALKKCDGNEQVVIDKDIYLGDDAVSIYLTKGSIITVDELLHGLLIASANDCAVALARHISGSEKKFAQLMNETAKELGATHSHFCNPHGLDEENHYSCAYDLYLIFQKDLENPHFQDIIKKDSYTIHYTNGEGEKIKTGITTTNQYFKKKYSIPDGITVLGGKTGTTDLAGSCLVLHADGKNGEDYIGVVLHATDKNQLYETMSKLLSEAVGSAS